MKRSWTVFWLLSLYCSFAINPQYLKIPPFHISIRLVVDKLCTQIHDHLHDSIIGIILPCAKPLIDKTPFIPTVDPESRLSDCQEHWYPHDSQVRLTCSNLTSLFYTPLSLTTNSDFFWSSNTPDLLDSNSVPFYNLKTCSTGLEQFQFLLKISQVHQYKSLDPDHNSHAFNSSTRRIWRTHKRHRKEISLSAASCWFSQSVSFSLIFIFTQRRKVVQGSGKTCSPT